MLPKEQRHAWAAFYDSARNNDQLDERTTVMLHLAVAMTSGCEP